jgi:hypothetical protein
MRNNYVNKGHSILGLRCVTMEGNDRDLTLAGELGEIWQDGPEYLKAFVIHPSGDEKIIRFKNKDLYKWVSKLKVPPNPDEQAILADRRNK